MHDVLIGAKILSKNEEIAQRTRKEFNQRGIFSINLVSSPGSGKTSIVEKTVERLKDRIKIAVIAGDIQTDLDSKRLKKYAIPVKQITTGRACHLDALMVRRVVPWLFVQGGVELLIIENVGNMVCPAEYDLGEDMKVAVMSVTEGDDKPLKYPSLFHASRLLLINKTDLLGYTDFSVDRACENALKINPALRVFETSCVTGAGLDTWCDHLEEMVECQATIDGQ